MLRQRLLDGDRAHRRETQTDRACRSWWSQAPPRRVGSPVLCRAAEGDAQPCNQIVLDGPDGNVHPTPRSTLFSTRANTEPTPRRRQASSTSNRSVRVDAVRLIRNCASATRFWNGARATTSMSSSQLGPLATRVTLEGTLCGARDHREPGPMSSGVKRVGWETGSDYAGDRRSIRPAGVSYWERHDRDSGLVAGAIPAVSIRSASAVPFLRER